MKNQSLNNKNERGAVMIEAAITMPIILLLLTATYDVGNALNAAFRVQDFARLGLHQISSQLDLEQGNFKTDSSGCRMTSPTAGPCSVSSDHRAVHNAVKNMITQAGDISIDPNSIIIETSLKPIPTASGQTDVVTIKISGTYTGMFFPFNRLPISLAETGPKL